MKKRGKLIVFEGVEGAGVEVQTKLITDYLKETGKKVKRLYYPDYSGPIGRLIHEYLHSKFNLSVDLQFLLYAADFIKDKTRIEEWLEQGNIIIADRYFTSTLAYQGLRGFSIEKALEFANLFSIPKPDLIIFLKISAEVSIKRKLKEKDDLDRNESDKNFIKQVSNFYDQIIQKQIFAKWVVIDGEKTIEEVSEDIKEKLKLLTSISFFFI
jgi:dTMP kinase